MSEQWDGKPDDESFQDIHLDDIIKGVGSLFQMASDFLEALGSGGWPPSGPASARRERLVDIFDEGREIILVVELPRSGSHAS